MSDGPEEIVINGRAVRVRRDVDTPPPGAIVACSLVSMWIERAGAIPAGAGVMQCGACGADVVIAAYMAAVERVRPICAPCAEEVSALAESLGRPVSHQITGRDIERIERGDA